MSIQPQIRSLLADRTAPETRALFMEILKYVDRRTKSVGHRAWSDLLPPSELEEIAADVVLQLMSGTLAQFRGESLAELFGFIRTITDRSVWHKARKKLKERDALEGTNANEIRDWNASMRAPEARIAEDVPLTQVDQEYLTLLLEAGSKVELARRQGVSRAAVTQRVKRITQRIQDLGPEQRSVVDVWLHRQARHTIEHVPGMTASLRAE